MVSVVLDTSFLILLVSRATSGFNLVEKNIGRLEMVVLGDVVGELKRLANGPSVKKAKEARLGLSYAELLRRVEHDCRGKVDDKILDYSLKNKAFVATMDRDLMKRLTSAGVGVITCSNNIILVLGRK